MKRNILGAVCPLFFLALFLVTPTVLASNVNLAWNANSEPNLAGYKVYYGTASRIYGAPIVLGNQTTYTVSGLGSGTYYFAITAYNTSGYESTYSNEIAVTPTSTTTGVSPATSGPVIAVSMNENNGSTLSDSSGNGNSGTAVGATWTPAGKYSSGLSFDGVSSYASIGVKNVPPANAPQTISAWFWVPSIPGGVQTLLTLGSPASGSAIQLGFINSSLVAWKWGGAILASSAPPSPAVWNYVTYTFDGGTHRLYLNGTLVSSSTTPPQSAVPSLFEIARFPGGEYFRGIVDEVRVYNRALAASEIQSDMVTPIASATTSPPPPSTDTTAPAIAISSPVSNALVTGTVTVTANASDNVGIAGVQFLLNGAALGAERTSPPYSVSWDTTRSANATYTLSARARDAAGNTSVAANVLVAVSNVDLTTGLVAAFGFNEGTGTTTADSSGNSNTATLRGAAWSASGRFGRALSFNGSTAYVTAGVNKLPATNAPQTITWWLNVPSICSTVQAIMTLANPSSQAAVQPGFQRSTVGVWKYGGTWLASANPPSANAWHHYAYTFDGTTHRLYIDGNLAGSSTTAPQAAGVTNLEFGRWLGNSEYLLGMLDEVRIYNRVLTQSAIQAVRNTPLP